MIVLAEVLTNCEEDEYRRVRLKATGVWEKSELTPSENGIYLDKGDRVLVNIDYGVDNAYIVAKYFDKKQLDKSKKSSFEGVLIYEAQNGSDWQQLRVSKQNMFFENSDGVRIKVEGKAVSVESTDVSIKCENAKVESTDVAIKCDSAKVETKECDLKGDNIKITGKVTFANGFGAPDGTGPLCAIPNCLFSGAPQCASSTK